MAKGKLVVEMLLDDGKMRTRGCKTLKQLLGRTRNAAKRRRNANSCSQDLYALLEDLEVAE